MHCIQQTAEWHEMRQEKIGASDAPIIMGVSPWKTPYQLWEEKVGLSKNNKQTEWMKRGLDLEEEARKVFERETGLIVFPTVMFHKEHEFMMASLDGITIEGKHAVEIKCPGKVDHFKAMSGEIPEKYYPQLQHQLEVTGLDMIYYLSYTKDTWRIIEVQRDQTYIEKLLNEEKKFFKKVKAIEAPSLTPKDFVHKDDDLWRYAAEEWIKCQEQIKQLKEKEEELRVSLICMAGELNACGHGIRVSKFARKGPVDYSEIPELKIMDLDQYRKGIVEGWRLSKE